MLIHSGAMNTTYNTKPIDQVLRVLVFFCAAETITTRNKDKGARRKVARSQDIIKIKIKDKAQGARRKAQDKQSRRKV